MAQIHPTAIVSADAALDDDVVIGPYCVIEGPVRLGAGVRLLSHVALAGHTDIGAGSVIYPFASIGHAPQDLKYAGEASRLEIGAQTTIREYVTMNPGTESGGMITRVGAHGLFMAGAHVAHDCEVGDHVIFANNATLGGHCTIGDHVFLGGLTACQQWVRIGAHAFIGGCSGVTGDIVPFMSAFGTPAQMTGLNIVGLRRAGFTRTRLHALRQAARALFSEEGTEVEHEKDYADNPDVMRLVAFLNEKSHHPRAPFRRTDATGT